VAIVANAEDDLIEGAGLLLLLIVVVFALGIWKLGKAFKLPDWAHPDLGFSGLLALLYDSVAVLPAGIRSIANSFLDGFSGVGWKVVDKMPFLSTLTVSPGNPIAPAGVDVVVGGKGDRGPLDIQAAKYPVNDGGGIAGYGPDGGD